MNAIGQMCVTNFLSGIFFTAGAVVMICAGRFFFHLVIFS